MKLWGVDINGRRGYANKDFIMEKKILVPDAKLTFEVPVVGPGSPSPSPPAVAEPLQTVLNASESSDDLATTTTAPLDVQVDAIVVEHNKSMDQQAPEPTTASQAQLVQLVDGTALPLEAIPAVTDSTLVTPPEPSKPNEESKSELASTDVDKKEPQEAAVDEKKPQDATDDTNKPQDASVDEKKSQDATADLQKPQEATVDAKKPQEEPTERPAAGEQDSSELPEAINTELDDTDDFDYGDDEEDDDHDDELNQDSEDKESTNNEQLNDKKAIDVNETINVEQMNTTHNIEMPKEEASIEQADLGLAEAKQEEVATESTERPKELTTESPKEVQETIVESKPLEALKVEETTEKIVVPETPPAHPSVAEKVDDGAVKADTAAEIKTETGKEEVAITNEPVVVHSETTSTDGSSIEEDSVKSEPVGLPPLFEKKNFENPNDYYKQLQEQQQQQQQKLKEEQNQRLTEDVEEQKQQQAINEEAEALRQQQQQQLSEPVNPESNEVIADPNDYYKQQQSTESTHHQAQDYHHHSAESAEQTTISPVPESPFGAVHEAEPTPAPQPARSESAGVGSVEPIALPATASPSAEVPLKDNAGLGLFATIVDTVNNFIGKDPENAQLDGSDELQRILYPGMGEAVGSPRKASQGNFCCLFIL